MLLGQRQIEAISGILEGGRKASDAAYRRSNKLKENSYLNEDYARGIPDFALSQVASSTSEELRRHLIRHISQIASDPAKQRSMLAAANVTLEELEKDIKDLLEDKMLDFLRRT